MSDDAERDRYRRYIQEVASLSALAIPDERVEELIPIVKEYFDSAARLDSLEYSWATEPALVYQMHPIRRD